MTEASCVRDDYLTDEQLNRLDYLDAKNQVKGFIIKCVNHGKVLYSQHPSNGGYWTQYRDNARVFTSEAQAKKVMGLYKYGKLSIERW